MHCGTSGRKKGYSLKSAIHLTQIKWLVQENNRLQGSQQYYEQDSFQDGECQGYNGFAGSGGLFDYLGSGRSISSYKNGTRIEQVFRLHIQKQGLLVWRPSEQIKTGVRYYTSFRNVEEIVLENIREQMPNECKYKRRIPGLDLGDIESYCENACKEKKGNAEEDKLLDQMDIMQKIFTDSRDCSITRRSQFPTSADGGYFASFIINIQDENRGIKDKRMEWKVLSDWEDEGRPNMVEEEDKIERSSMLQEGYSKTLLNDGCVRNRLGRDAGGNSESTVANLCIRDIEQNSESQILKSKRNESCSDEFETFHQDYSERKLSLHSKKQHSNRILSVEVENKSDDVPIIEESETICNTIRNQNLNEQYSWNIELNNRQLGSNGNKRKLLTGSTNAVENVPKTSDLPKDRWLRESNQQVTKKISQLITRQQRRRTGSVQSELAQKRTNLERIIEAINSKRDETKQSVNSSESGSSIDSESIKAAFRGTPRCKDDKHALREQLFRIMLGATVLGGDTIEIVIGLMSLETWRKKRADIHILNEFFEDQKIYLDILRQMRADVTLVNALT
ncbi:MAG: hypothetical protein EZS28_002614 [Streblomastix strix]|uniref:Uncharacterized protein n=1 Tax=Streblomastix strix TaxID=222440 RepID=A0A5J4X4E6_9EUKA|nr:MAG: hypothetical protein EZS28_002614 [Streblomastix strix]